MFGKPSEYVQDRVAAVIELTGEHHGPHPVESVVEEETVPL